MIETLYLAGSILCASLSLAVIISTADMIGEWFKDYGRHRRLCTDKRHLQEEIHDLKKQLSLWKKACDNLDKEVSKNEAEKAGTTT